MKPLLRGHLHQAMFFITLGAGITLFGVSQDEIAKIAVGIYLVCALIMFGISSLYHRINWTPERRLLWKKLDHAGIYLMIAGTFTPIALLALSAPSNSKLLITIWSVAFVGILQSIFFVNLPKMVSALIYLIAGYLILPYLSELKLSIGMGNIVLILAGGIAYSIGAIAYGLKKPVLARDIFGYHEFFHFFVNLGAALHFIVVCSLAVRG